jgi:DnaJ-domain-containing protein 1
VKLTRALVQNLDEAVKEVKLLGEHEEESSQKITELEALCKKPRDDTQRLEEEKATLEGMVESHDELLMEIAREMGLDRMGEDEEEEEEDVDDGGDAAAPPAAAPPPPVPPATVPEEINKEALWRQSWSKKFRCRTRSSWQRLSPRYHNSVSIVHS